MPESARLFRIARLIFRFQILMTRLSDAGFDVPVPQALFQAREFCFASVQESVVLVDTFLRHECFKFFFGDDVKFGDGLG